MAQKISKYQVVVGTDARAVNDECKKLINAGWQPFGSVSVSAAVAFAPKQGMGMEARTEIAQAMVVYSS